MNPKDDLEVKIGQAWKAHYAGEDESAVGQFLSIIDEAPDSADAYWGLGLAYRDLGDKHNALQAFEKVKALVADQIEQEAGQWGRFFMLNRMVTQQIEQMNEFMDNT